MVRVVKAEAVGHVVKHSRHAIYSVDFQPTAYGSSRLATAGGDCTVKLWDLAAIMEDSKGGESDALLATLSTHSKSVNVVRWSSDGQFLASGSDDSYVLIFRYTPDAISTQPFGSSGPKNKENWSRFLTLQGHSMDVLDLAWSPRGLLASGSVDNNIHVWDCRTQLMASGTAAMTTSTTFGGGSGGVVSPHRVLSGHISFVKGVAFDPLGRYLASAGGDNVVIIWDCDTWAPVVALDGPLRHSEDRTLFRRLSWAPDGSSLCVTCATKASKPVGMVLKRGSWESVADLVGHSTNSVCCRFCPAVVSSTSSGRKGPGPSCCVAMGDQQGLVSLWSTARHTPLLVLRDAFRGAATDAAWLALAPAPPSSSSSSSSLSSSSSASASASPPPPCGGLIVAVCSLDGTVVFVDLGSEAGAPLADEALERHFRGLYGRGPEELLQAAQQRHALAPVVVHPAALRYMGAAEKARALAAGGLGPPQERRPPTAPPPTSSGGPDAPSVNVLSLQVQSRRGDGKKRIAPVRLMANGQPADAPPLPSSSASSSSSSSSSSGFDTYPVARPKASPAVSASSVPKARPADAGEEDIDSSSNDDDADEEDDEDDGVDGRDENGGGDDIVDDNLPLDATAAPTAPPTHKRHLPPQHPASTDCSSTVAAIIQAKKPKVATSSSSSSSSSSAAAGAKAGLLSVRLGAAGASGKPGANGAAKQAQRAVVPTALVLRPPTPAVSAVRHPLVSQLMTAVGTAPAPATMPPFGAAAAVAGAQPGALPARVLQLVFRPDEVHCTVPLSPLGGTLRAAVRRAAPVAPTGVSASSAGGAGGLARRTPAGLEAPLILHADRLLPPASSGSFCAGGASSASLAVKGAFTSVSLVDGHETEAWRTAVCGEVTCVCGAASGDPIGTSARPTDRADGLCAAGCADGTLHLLSLQSGFRVAPPMVLGTAVAAVDALPMASRGEIRVLAVTADCELWVWLASAAGAVDGGAPSFRCVVRTTLRPAVLAMRSAALATAPSAAGAQAQAQAQAASPLRRSARAAFDGAEDFVPSSSSSSSSSSSAAAAAPAGGPVDVARGVLVSLEHCRLAEPHGQVSAALLVKPADASATATSAGAGRCVGGAWQQFSFCETSLAWVRAGDLRHAASLLFRPADATDAGHDEARPGDVVPAAPLRWQPTSASCSAAEASAAKWGGLGLAQVLHVARSAAAAVDTWAAGIKDRAVKAGKGSWDYQDPKIFNHTSAQDDLRDKKKEHESAMRHLKDQNNRKKTARDKRFV